ncbi:MAG: glycerate kinase [Clostridium sp.]|nr:glycerate kinase [Clostridium sp.]
MNVLISIDSFKGSMTSMQAGRAAKAGILKAVPDADVTICPLADGGEGTTDALVEGMGGEKIELEMTGPLREKVNCYYGFIEDKNTAVMEMASAAGLTLVDEKNPMLATTFGVGEMIADAVKRGCENIIIGIGGSATNDGGIGMLKALGYQFLDENGKDVGDGAAALGKVQKILDNKADTRLSKVNFMVACDVDNPLCGKNGATYIFGVQKGVTEEMKPVIDSAMKCFADKTKEKLGISCENVPGAGAAGGLGFAFLSYLNAKLVPGVKLVMQAADIEEKIKKADIVVTGEGRLDSQTVMGKAPIGVARLAKKYNKKVIAFAGSVSEDAVLCNENGIDAFFPIVRGIITLDEAVKTETAMKNMELTAEQVFRLMK